MNPNTLSFSTFFLYWVVSPTHSQSFSELRSRTFLSPSFIPYNRVFNSNIYEESSTYEYVSLIASHTSFVVERNKYVFPITSIMELTSHAVIIEFFKLHLCIVSALVELGFLVFPHRVSHFIISVDI